MDSRAHRIPTRFFPATSRWMAEVFRVTLWGSECKDTTADTGTAASGLGRTRIFPAPTVMRVYGQRAPWKHWSTKCHSGWSFAKRCSGMMGRNTNSGICRRSKESPMNSDGIFLARRKMDSDWKQRSMALGRAFTGSFEVANNSLASAVLRLERRGGPVETLETSTGAVLEMVGR